MLKKSKKDNTRYANTFAMRSDKLKYLLNIGFTMDEAIILKEELFKAKDKK